MKIYSKLFAIILSFVLIFSVSSLFFGVAAESAPGEGNDAASDDNAADTNDETTGEEKTEEKEENFFEAFASMFKSFHPQGFVEQLGVMGIGMLGIFIIIGIIIVATVIINKAFSAKVKKED